MTMPTISEIPINILQNYAERTRFIILATINEKNEPILRTLASWAIDGHRVYFATNVQSAKVQQIRQNSHVSILLQQEEQELGSFVNIAFTGEAEPSSDEERERAIIAISDRSPRFRERVEKGELDTYALFTLLPREIKVLDFTKGIGQKAITVYQQ
jgi:pyridoxamine 5'-phosphate oxidase